jgi:putative ABC transport system permease protein
LFTRSLTQAESVDLGFNPHQVLNVGIDPGLQGYDQAKAELFFRELLRRTKGLPGVQSASLAFSIPLGYYNDGASIYVEGQEVSSGKRVPGGPMNPVTPDYFQTMGVRILAGREFTDADTSTSMPVAIINQKMAEQFWPHQDPLGRRFSHKGTSGPFVTIVGVAGNAKTTGLLDEMRPGFYVPQSQEYKSIHVLQVRTSVPAETMIPVVQAQIRDLDPNLATFDVATMDQALTGANGFFLFKMGAEVAGALGVLGLMLAVVGVYGVVSYTASRRRHEIGIRMALGAQPLKIFGLVIRQAVVLVGAGVGIGILAALAVARLLTSLLVGVTSYDPPTFAAVSALLAGVALVACYLPAHRAARVDPMVALRHE